MTGVGMTIAMLVVMWAALLFIVVGVFYGVVHAGKRYPLLGLLVAAVLLAGLASPIRREVER